MKRPYAIQNGNNVPLSSPLIPTPFVPYQCADCRHVNVFCRAEPDLIKKYLENTPFEYAGNTVLIYISDFTNIDVCPFWDCGIVIQAKYKDIVGGYFLFEYEDQDYSIAAGRELWGYPKKYADISMVEESNKVTAKAIKNGRETIRLELDLTAEYMGALSSAPFVPHLLLHTVPNGDKPGIFSQRVMTRDTTPDFQTRTIKSYEAKICLRNVGVDPLDEFASMEVLYGTYQVGEYFATEENGWAKVIDTII